MTETTPSGIPVIAVYGGWGAWDLVLGIWYIRKEGWQRINPEIIPIVKLNQRGLTVV